MGSVRRGGGVGIGPCGRGVGSASNGAEGPVWAVPSKRHAESSCPTGERGWRPATRAAERWGRREGKRKACGSNGGVRHWGGEVYGGSAGASFFFFSLARAKGDCYNGIPTSFVGENERERAGRRPAFGKWVCHWARQSRS